MCKLRNLFTKRGKKNQRKKFLEETISKDNYPPFMEEVDKAIAKIIKDIPDSRALLKAMYSETNKWANDLPETNTTAFRFGVCWGIYSYLKQVLAKETKCDNYVV